MERIGFSVTQEIELWQLINPDALQLFNLIDRNREHLSQWDDRTAKKYPNLPSIIKSIVTPEDSNRLRFGIWYQDQLAGAINLTVYAEEGRATVGYWVAKEFSHRGLATMATTGIINYARQYLPIKQLEATVHKQNLYSQKLLQFTGFHRSGEMTDHICFKLVFDFGKE